MGSLLTYRPVLNELDDKFEIAKMALEKLHDLSQLSDQELDIAINVFENIVLFLEVDHRVNITYLEMVTNLCQLKTERLDRNEH